jgi:hypothetical protein
MGEDKPAERIEHLEPMIFTIRRQRVMLDADLAHLYGVATRALNQAVKRNSERFPDDFAFQLTTVEATGLRSQIAAPGSQPAERSRDVENRSQIVTGSQRHRDPALRPWAFTEHGALMAANILRSEQAVRMSVYVIRAFVRLREVVAANSAILKRLAEIDRTLLQHDAALRDIYRKLLPLLQPLPDPPKRRIGFRTGDE